ncbi:serine aminopeptidase domain-containing protein [Thalassomonas actiniarum]|uniref:Alpha/beta hydrolase n=1 Tax=Thalassomonas actiniarum TaxID=485447 RepID=A0AAE9YR85_9GAMM|nr:alpha/beta hydrolase [Thalassomonas actiniarum]WDD98938.1 alpha/beta hydrolase [Thalassomonas actiniarum]
MVTDKSKVVVSCVMPRGFHALLYLVLFAVLLMTPVSQAKGSPRLSQLSPAAPDKNAGQSVSFQTQDKFLIHGNYFPGEEDASGALILHDCNRDSSRYAELGKTLSANGLHALTIDLRGFGRSISEEFSERKIHLRAQDITTYQGQLAALRAYWHDDVMAAYLYLRKKIERSQGISVVASGCSSVQAVSLADKMHINAMVLITPIMDYADKERYKELMDIPSYFINSAQHLESFKTAKELFEWNGSRKSKSQIFKGNRVEQALLNANHYLVEDITLWLKMNQ